jgi:hypothetical protein
VAEKRHSLRKVAIDTFLQTVELTLTIKRFIIVDDHSPPLCSAKKRNLVLSFYVIFCVVQKSASAFSIGTLIRAGVANPALSPA